MFYQWHPLGPVHGLKYWYHTKSKDLVHWENAGIGLKPDAVFDRHGVYSGSANENDGKLHLFYTGNTRDENSVRHPYQCIAVMDSFGNISKLDKPVIDHAPSRYTEHFRDPKVWKDGNKFYAVIGLKERMKQAVPSYTAHSICWNGHLKEKSGLSWGVSVTCGNVRIILNCKTMECLFFRRKDWNRPESGIGISIKRVMSWAEHWICGKKRCGTVRLPSLTGALIFTLRKRWWILRDGGF